MANISDDFQTRWWALEEKLMNKFGKKPDVEAILFLIGLQETGFIREKISKEQKQDLMHVAVCKILSSSGYYLLEGKDEDGWPHFKQTKNVPEMELMEQEAFLKDHILLYFENNQF
jgi:hypothetical protein